MRIPPEPEVPLVHERTYDVRAYRKSATELLIRGAVRDDKPGDLYVPDDPEPLTFHHMVVDLVVGFPTMEITHAEVVMETHPHEECTRIEPHYENLVGLSIARGFTHKVRELFGGPRGCTHTTALLQAMAPVAIQSIWSMRMLDDGSEMVAPPLGKNPTPEQIRERMAFNINSCHVWADDSEMWQRIDAGEEFTLPRTIIERLEARGLDADSWRERMG